MKCPNCGTENEGNICVKCGSHLYNNSNIENSIFFSSINNVEISKKLQDKNCIHDEKLKSIIDMTHEIISDNKPEDNDLEKKGDIEIKNNSLLEAPKKEESLLFENNEIELVDNIENVRYEQNSVLLTTPNQEEPNLFDNNGKTMVNNNVVQENIHDTDLNEEEIIINSQVNNYESIDLQSDISQNSNDLSEKDELHIFINKNADNIINKKYGIVQGLLGNIWLLYRKCYLLGIILGIFDFIFILYVVFLTETSVLVYLILRFILYFIISKKMYIKQAKRKIRNLKNKYSNLTEKEFNNILKKYGGTFIIAPIIFITVVIILLIIGTIFIYKFSTYRFNELNIQAKGWTLNGNNGLIYVDDEKSCIADISYGLKTDENIISQLYHKSIITEEQYNNKLDYNFDEMDKEVINKNEWFKITVLNENNTYEDIMLINKNNVVYFINFKGNEIDDYALCQPKFIDFKNSLKFN